MYSVLSRAWAWNYFLPPRDGCWKTNLNPRNPLYAAGFASPLCIYALAWHGLSGMH